MPLNEIQAVANSPLITIGGFALGIIGIILAIYFYFLSKKERIPCFEVNSKTLIEGLNRTLEGIQLHYKGIQQERITVSKLSFWNAGTETIDARDLVEADPIGISFPLNIQILDIQVISVSAKSNSVELGEPVTREAINFLPVTFEYLDHNDFFVVQIVHNGSDREKIRISGKVKGVKAIKKISDLYIDNNIFKILPIPRELERLISSRSFMKYAGSLSYIFFGAVGAWNLLQGNLSWYVWALTVFCFAASAILYFEHQHLSPVKI